MTEEWFDKLDEQENFDDLLDMVTDGFCPTRCPEGCIVEPDGMCPHGHESILLEKGLI